MYAKVDIPVFIKQIVINTPHLTPAGQQILICYSREALRIECKPWFRCEYYLLVGTSLATCKSE